jgi:hypothetical protein
MLIGIGFFLQVYSLEFGQNLAARHSQWGQAESNGVRPDIRTFEQWGQAGHSDIWAGGPNVRMSGLTPLLKCPNVRPDPIALGLTPLRMPCGQILSKLQNKGEHAKFTY